MFLTKLNSLCFKGDLRQLRSPKIFNIKYLNILIATKKKNTKNSKTTSKSNIKLKSNQTFVVHKVPIRVLTIQVKKI